MAKSKLTFLHFPTLVSTNLWCKEKASSPQTFPADTPVVVIADTQTGGIGRLNRKWKSTENNILTSFCYRTKKNDLFIPQLAQLLAFSAARLLKKLNIPVTIKWPNDLLLGGKKLGGILCQIVQLPEEIVIINGIGLNVNMPEEFLKTIDQPATSLKVETGQNWDHRALLEKMAQEYFSLLDLFLETGEFPYFSEFQTLSRYTSELITLQEGEVFQGYFEEINKDGSLKLKLLNGTFRSFHSGQIVKKG